MAGIGFRLQKLLSEETITGTMKAYVFSALIMAGPLLLTIFTLSFLHWVSLAHLSFEEQAYLRALITYSFAFSLVAVGGSQLVVTRFLADEYYRKHLSHYTAVFFSSVTLNGMVWCPMYLLYLSTLSVSWSIKLNTLLLFLFVLGTWLALLFLSAARDYLRPVKAFLTGSVVAMAASWFLGARQGMNGYLAGFVLGQATTFVLLALAILKEFRYQEPRDYYWLDTYRRFPYLAGIGFFMNVGMWVDKFIFWASPEGEWLDRTLRYSQIYDGPMFLAYLTVLPSLAYFLMRMETDFFSKYQAYYQSIQNQKSFLELERRKADMVENLQRSVERLIILQSIVSGVAMLAVPWIALLMKMDPLYMGVFRIGILGSFLQVCFLVAINLLLYFDVQKDAFVCSLFFCVSNAVLTDASLRFGLPAYGFGFVMAGFLSLLMAFFFLNRRLKDLHYWTFMKQPLFRPIQVSDED